MYKKTINVLHVISFLLMIASLVIDSTNGVIYFGVIAIISKIELANSINKN